MTEVFFGRVCIEEVLFLKMCIGEVLFDWVCICSRSQFLSEQMLAPVLERFTASPKKYVATFAAIAANATL